jgi:DNA primase catalytic subunit
MSHATAVEHATDDMIRVLGTRERGVIVDYAIGNKISVSYRGEDRYLCGTCQGNNRFRAPGHPGCEHIARIRRYREEHP